jgi:hypothetical protein
VSANYERSQDGRFGGANPTREEERNFALYRARCAGATYGELAESFEINKARAHQIVKDVESRLRTKVVVPRKKKRKKS